MDRAIELFYLFAGAAVLGYPQVLEPLRMPSRSRRP